MGKKYYKFNIESNKDRNYKKTIEHILSLEHLVKITANSFYPSSMNLLK